MRKLLSVWTLLTGTLLGGFGLMALPSPAHAGLNVCNQAGAVAKVALGRFDGVNWTSAGWWVIAPKSCVPLLTGALDARYYYLYATDGAAGTWEGKTHFCVATDAKFTIPGRGDCNRKGFDRRGFFEIDTGDAPNWTQTLSN